jgi:hypothetical protein
MGRYMVLFEADQTRLSSDPKERASQLAGMVELTKKEMEMGLIKESELFFGESAGYAIYEGPEVEVMASVQKRVPYLKCKVHVLATLSQLEEVIKVLQE